MTTTGSSSMTGWMAMDVDILQKFVSPMLESVCSAWFLVPSFLEQVSIATNVFFVVVLAVALLYNLILVNETSNLGVNWQIPISIKSNSFVYIVRVIATCTAALVFFGAAAWEHYIVVAAGSSAGNFDSVVRIIFLLAQGMTWVIFAAFSAAEVRRAPRLLSSRVVRALVRLWWIGTCFLAGIHITSRVIRKIENCPSSSTKFRHETSVALATEIVNLVSSLVLVATAFLFEAGRTGKFEETRMNGDAEEPLLHQSLDDVKVDHGYSGASWLSRLTWLWMNPLLQKGHDSRLEVDDVPNLAVQDDAQNLYERYTKHWSRSQGNNRVRSTLFRSFQREFLETGLLALCRACVMYVGPALIPTFVSFKTVAAAGEQNGGLWWGCLLVFALALSKGADVLASHHFNFQCNNLGMAIRSTMITVVYRKGVRLTNAARLSHGLGQIVNYMSVDVQVLADVILQVHNLWLLPIQVGIALVILFSVVGWSSLAGLLTMVSIVAYSTWSGGRQREFQALIMKAKDKRMKATSEALNAMKVIKLQAWETHFRGYIENLREQEFHWIMQFMYQVAYSTVFIWCSPSVVSVATFACCVLLEGTQLTPGQVFTAVATFRVLQDPIRNFPQTLIAVSQAQVSLDRLEKYLGSEELDTNAVDRNASEAYRDLAISVRSASFAWTASEDGHEKGETTTLHNIDVEVKKGSLVAVVGTVGSGKSSLLACMLGEMPKLQGTVCVAGRTAYVPQGAWIQSGTIEENILFGQAMDRRRYNETLRVCSLERDMEIMEHGDQTEIGERGLNLSGGQKQRIQLARAVYQDCDVYLLDDIFSAVDAHTGSAIFKDCVKGMLKKKTVILVTHQIDFLHEADSVLVMRSGMIAQCGKYLDLLQPGTELETLVTAHNESMQLVESESATDLVGEDASVSLYKPDASLERRVSVKESITRALSSGRSTSVKPGPTKLVEEEQREIGRVSSAIYKLYLTKAFGPWLIILLFIVQIGWQTMMLLSDYWLAYETSDGRQGSLDPGNFIRVYAALSFGTWICVFLRTSLIILFGSRTTQVFFLEMLRSIFRAPMAFFDTTPSGRILSRASVDQSTLDIMMAFFFGSALAIYFSLLGAIAVMCQTAWPIIFVMLPLAYVFFMYQAYFIATSRELTRMESITKAPIIHHFAESIAGFMVIRCFKKEHEFAKLNVDRVNQNVRMVFHNNAATEWLGYRLEMIGTIVLCSSALLLVVLPARLAPPQLVGLALSYGLSLNSLLYWAVWLVCQLENKMVSVERIHQFTNIPSEAPLVVPERRPAANWPSKGAIEFHNLQLRYRPGTPVVLKGITLKIVGGEKVGVVGRTGSGKSTLIQALFRLVEASAGQIVIDGVDIATLGLSDLRSKFAIIPQEPTLFEGTVRANIDPLGHHSDNEIWECLKACQLADIIRGMPEKLDSPVADDGDNWSVGQKQLFCLGRALLKRAKILVLDEATASVDAHTDWLIQQTVQESFANSTVISIAHRIPTVMNCNKVLVLDAGRVKEYDSPSRLLEAGTSLFAALVQEYTTRGHYEDVED
ncbi:hypothetical protein KC19_12G129500 [Ceratodon purpureus]|uniref:Uncharacterized protein n=1 Tax=Ceratodon purpureus TaxID=3225 RepID=A0A8T0GCD4_CERPU|nr:hypothetical protein KC19_12G129500 [Ceratodon purpureus]